jgi:hypothetical protein
LNWQRYNPPAEAIDVLSHSPNVIVASTSEELVDLACGGPNSSYFEVAYDVPGKGRYVEATVMRVRNGVAANYTEPYMRRRDPDCLFIADELPTDKTTYRQHFGQDFEPVKHEALAWLKTQKLAMFAFTAGQPGMGLNAIAIVPTNAGFFALGLAMLQGIIPEDDLPDDFTPQAVIYAIPPFRHTHFAGRQVVVHNRRPGLYEMFSFNLYPGPSAKKGVYGMLLDLGDREGWVTAHGSTVQVVTPYDQIVTIMHEGASGGGKSEMLEQPHREPDGRMLLGQNLVSGERRHLEISRSCELLPVTDDMALCHPAIQDAASQKLMVTDAENAWFVRVNHINFYGVDMNLERLTAQPGEPLLFLNIDTVPDGRALIWEHTMDAPGKPCPNPRVIIPRRLVPNVVDRPVNIDVRSFGVRTPPCTRDNPSYGIIGLFHILPPALAWLWRLVSPRGHDNPSIVDSSGIGSEGVGSYWPFAVGRRVRQANLLLEQFTDYTRTRHVLCPNQHIGAWRVGFMPEWIAREYLARRGGARFKPGQLTASRCALLGYNLYQVHVEGQLIPRWLVQVETQPEVGEEAYDQGAELLYAFFHKILPEYLTPDLDPLGRQIIECCLDKGSVTDYEVFGHMD